MNFEKYTICGFLLGDIPDGLLLAVMVKMNVPGWAVVDLYWEALSRGIIPDWWGWSAQELGGPQ